MEQVKDEKQSDRYLAMMNLAFRYAMLSKTPEEMERFRVKHRKYQHLFKQAVARERNDRMKNHGRPQDLGFGPGMPPIW